MLCKTTSVELLGMVALFVTNWQDFQKIQLCGTIFVAIYNVRV